MAPGRPALGRRVVARWNTVSVFSFSHSQTAILLDLVDKGGGPSRPVPTPARSATLGSRRPMRDAADGFRSAAGPAFVPGGAGSTIRRTLSVKFDEGMIWKELVIQS